MKMKRLAILSLAVLLFTACSDDNDPVNQNQKDDLSNYTHIGDIYSNELSDSKIGDWRFDKNTKALRIDVNRTLINGTSLSTGQVLVSGHLLGITYYNASNFKLLGNLFSDTTTVVIPEDFACDLDKPADAVNACLILGLYDSNGNLIHSVFAEFE
jgi:hypothetical protein